MSEKLAAEPEAYDLPEHEAPSDTFGMYVVANYEKDLREAALGNEEADPAFHHRTTEAAFDKNDEGTTIVRQGMPESAADELQYMRRDLNNMHPEDHEIISKELEHQGIPDFIRDRLPETVPGVERRQPHVTERLKHPDVTDEQLLNFAQWHVNAAGERQHQIDPAVTEAIENQKQKYGAAVTEAVSEGWLHPKALAAVPKVAEVPFQIGDRFDDLVMLADGYYSGRDRAVVTAGSVVDPKFTVDKVEEIAMHELNHLVLGDYGKMWLNEALTEHIAQSLKYGQPEVVNPDERDMQNETYIEERTVLAVMLKGGNQEIPASVATRAYSGDGEARSAFGEALSEAWLIPGARGALKDVYDYLDRYKQEELEHKPTDKSAVQDDALERDALIALRNDLQSNPRSVFGDKYKEPAHVEPADSAIAA